MDVSMLDYVAHCCMELTDALSKLSRVEDEIERESLINDHIRKVWSSMVPIDDFKRNLEWVNVSEPISLAYHCVDKVVVLDFWTYCCINCYHVLPDLEYLENKYKVEDGLVVIGVHCAKFENEKDSSNVLAAVQRYGIHHPVVNDAESTTWNELGIHCWPTLLVLGPGNKPVFVLTGEGHRNLLVEYVGTLIKHFGGRMSTAVLPVSPSHHIQSQPNQLLSFPGKVSLNPFYRGRSDDLFIAISDTGNHRVLLATCTGTVTKIIGGPTPGFKDGAFNEAKFNSPQGLCWLSSSVIAVCDTNNHSVRAIHIDDGNVEVLAGTGQQSKRNDMGGKCLGLQPLCSPWDVSLFCTPDMDLSIRPLPLPLPPPPPTTTTGPIPPSTQTDDKANVNKDIVKKDERRRVLLIACAGSHQIWALFLDTTIWWKYKTIKEGTCMCIAGSGAEAARNSAYPSTAAFAQPSGLALRSSGPSPEVCIADSESSSIRRLVLTTGQVSSLCGGDRNPLNLFAFGDVDDIGMEAKLQHPLGVAYCENSKTVYIADTYNHKIKKVDVSTQRVTTLQPTLMESTEPATFNEPSGLCVSPDGKYLYVADTNNHVIKLIHLTKNMCQDFELRAPQPNFVEPENLILYKNELFVNRKCGSLIIFFKVNLDSNAESKNIKFTPGAPQNWYLSVRDEDNRDVTQEEFEFVNCANKGSKLPGRVEMKLKNKTEKTHYRLYLSFQTALCDDTVCFTHTFTVRSTMLIRDSVKMIESYKITCKVNPVNRNMGDKDKKETTSS